MAKLQISIRLGDKGKAALDALIEHQGGTQASNIERALLELARKEGVPLPSKTSGAEEKDS